MDVSHADPNLDRLERENALDGRFERGIAKKYRWVMQQIRLAKGKAQLHQIGSLRLKRLKRPGNDEAMWLNDKWRLEMEFTGTPPDEQVTILRISNHYDD